MVEEFETKGPFTAAVPIVDALEFISTTRGQVAQLKIQEAGIRKGLNIFKIDQPPSHLIQSVEKVLVCYCKCLYWLLGFHHMYSTFPNKYSSKAAEGNYAVFLMVVC